MSSRVTLEFDGDDELRRFIERVKATGYVAAPRSYIGGMADDWIECRVVEASAVTEINKGELTDPDGIVRQYETSRNVAASLLLEFDTVADRDEVWDRITSDQGTLEVPGGYLPQVRRMEQL